MALTQDSAARKDRTQPTDANFQHRHFAEIARIIRECDTARFDRTALARYFADELAHQNSRFDRSRFLAACQP